MFTNMFLEMFQYFFSMEFFFVINFLLIKFLFPFTAIKHNCNLISVNHMLFCRLEKFK